MGTYRRNLGSCTTKLRIELHQYVREVLWCTLRNVYILYTLRNHSVATIRRFLDTQVLEGGLLR